MSLLFVACAHGAQRPAPAQHATPSLAASIDTAEHNLPSAEALAFTELLESHGTELAPSARAYALTGKHVRMVGFMADMELAPKGGFFLVPRPLRCDEAGGGTADLPLESVFVSSAATHGRRLEHITGPLVVVGTLEVGNVAASEHAPSSAFRIRLAPSSDARAATDDVAIASQRFPETFDIDHKILFGFGANGDRYETWLTRPRPIVDSLLSANIQTELKGNGYPAEPFNRSQSEGVFLRGQAVGQTQAVHTAADIPISAYAANPALVQPFVGVQRNTDVFFKLMHALSDD